MASAAQLEDLFYDAFGMYLRENHPSRTLRRRSGAELWDYAFDGLQLSHKESLSRAISVWWTAGDLVDGTWVPKAGGSTHPRPIVFCCSPGHESMPWSTPARASGRLVATRPLPSHGSLLGSWALSRSGGAQVLEHTLVLAAEDSPGTLLVERVWPSSTWADISFFDLWPTLGGSELASRDLWVDRKPRADGSSGLGSMPNLSEGCLLDLGRSYLLPGVYVLSTALLKSAPTVANNRAHSLDPSFVDWAMDKARTRGHYRTFPTWLRTSRLRPLRICTSSSAHSIEQIFAARQRSS